MIKHFNKNTDGRDFVVGDIHGMFRMLEAQLGVLEFDTSKDRLFSVGDLVDRGPESNIFDRWLDKPWFHAVKGNHEQMMIDAAEEYQNPLNQQAGAHHYVNGGDWFYGIPTVEQQCYAIMADELPIAIEVETDKGLVGIIHAECPLDDWGLFKSLYSDNKEYFDQVAMWSRKRIKAGYTRHVSGVVDLYVGHTVMIDTNPHTLGNVHYIDTGACFAGGKLTIVQIQ